MAEALSYMVSIDTNHGRHLLQEVMHGACEIWETAYNEGYDSAIISGDYAPAEGVIRPHR